MTDRVPEPDVSWHARLREYAVRWIGWSYDHPVLVLIVVAALTAFSGYYTEKLFHNVETDFATLLPDSDRSKQDLEELKERYGGSASFSILVSSPDFEANKKFVEALAAHLQKPALVDELAIRNVKFGEGPGTRFVRDRKFLYVDLEDLQTVLDRLKKRIRWEKCEKSPFCISMGEKPVFTTEDIEAKYRRRTGQDEGGNREGYLSNPEGTVLGMDVEVQVTGSQFDYISMLRERVIGEAQVLHPESYHPEMEVNLWGSLIRRQIEYSLIITEALRTAGLTVLLVCFVVWLYFRRFRPVLFMAISVLTAIAWTFALTYWHIGYLNQQTAFLGSIIIGNGINFSLIFMARLLEERRRGGEARESVMMAARTTIGATLTAALATAIAYGVLIFAEFKGFSQFGFMGGMGMLFCWLATFTVCPAALALAERIRPFVPKAKFAGRLDQSYLGSAWIGRLVEKHPRAIIAGGAALTVLSVIFIADLMREPFEYDFGKLRPRIGGTPEVDVAWNRHFQVFDRGRSSPLVVLTDSLDQSALVVEAVEEKANDPDSTIDYVTWLGTIVPERQDEKIEVIEEIRRTVDKEPIGWMSAEQREKIDQIRDALDVERITMDNVPEELLSQFREKDGTLGRVVLIYPKREIKLALGKNLIRFANEVQRLDLANGEVVWSSGTPIIFADMLEAVISDGPIVTMISYLGVIVALLLNFRSLRVSLFLMIFLTYGLLLLGGVMGLFDLRINFFNFIVIPISVGIGVDYHINVYKRYELDGMRSIRKAVTNSGGAVLMCSLTTMIGYGTMMISETPAIAIFGLLAAVSEITCVSSALLLKPAFLRIWELKRDGGESEGEAADDTVPPSG